MNTYITFDGYKYVTNQKTWRPSTYPQTQSRVLADGTLDIVHGPTILYVFEGEIEASVTPATGYGSPDNLRASLIKKQAFSMTDHYGHTYTLHSVGPNPERSLSPRWDSPSNKIYITIMFKGIRLT